MVELRRDSQIPDALPPQTHTASIADRIARGRALRERSPRKSHADWTIPKDRRDPIEILIEEGQARVQELLPLRYTRMKASPFAFLRGSAGVMAADLVRTARTGVFVQAAGDCHCLNFGGFATPERRLAFDINDFDETAVAPWEWDLKRLATSFAVATRGVLDKSARTDLASLVAHSYRETMRGLASLPVLDAWYRMLTIDDEEMASAIGLDAQALKKADRALTHAVAMISLGHSGGAKPRIEDMPPLVYHPKPGKAQEFHATVEAMLADYAATLIPERRTLFQRYRLADAAYKVVGVGSVGTSCGVLLMMSGDGEALYLQFKEATRSVLEPFAWPSPYAHHGERVVRGQRLLQAASDILLGYATGPTGRHMYIRQLRDAKIKPAIETMPARTLRRYATICGGVLARAHARSGDAVLLSAYLGRGTSFDAAIGAFAMAYARQTESDHAALVQAIKEGRLPDAEQDS
jgi:uncharacterized protein (DUF2252 family)